MLRVILICLLLNLSKVGAQYSVSGFINNHANSPIPFATIQVNIDNQLVSYTITNIDGNYTLNLEKTGVYTIKITHIGYDSKQETIEITKQFVSITKNYTLSEKTESLGELVLDFTPKVMKVRNDTIVYNLKKLTNGTENNLADIIGKLPGVEMTSNGQITVNGKLIKKLLIDGEELFKKQHRTTSQSITSEMVEGVRYLDKYKDFGNIEGFNNKQMHALDISIKDTFKNKITGDAKAQGGLETKALGHTNLYMLGGKLKLGFIGDWNNIGQQSITSYEYDQLTQTRETLDFSSKGSNLQSQNENTPKFFDPILDIEKRENTFGALSMVYKPSERFKISLLNITGNTKQDQQFLLTRIFFDSSSNVQQESREIKSSFFLNTSIVELGYHPNNHSFINYKLTYNPQKTNDGHIIHNTNQNTSTSFVQNFDDNGFDINQQLSFATKIGKKTLLKWSGLSECKELDIYKSIMSDSSFLGLGFSNFFDINQFQNKTIRTLGYELQTSTKFKKSKLQFHQGVSFSQDDFNNRIVNRSIFLNTIETERTDSYIGLQYQENITRKIKYTVKGEYRYLFFKRFDKVFENYFFLPTTSLNYIITPSEQINLDYSYDFNLPNSKLLNNGVVLRNYFTLETPSNIDEDDIFPSHSVNFNYINFNTLTGSNFLIFANYNFSPKFLSYNSFLDTQNAISIQNNTGNNKHYLTLGSRINYRLRKLKINIFANPNWSFSQEENQINFQDNIAKTSKFDIKLGLYSNYRKKINFSTGLNYEFINYRTSINAIETKSSILKPYIYLDGSFLKKKITWILGGEYAIYKSDINQTAIIDIKPSIKYKVNNTFELSLIGNNILNINNAEIAENINSINYTENRISKTIGGYLTLGVHYLIN
ncbi:carboxypeptidase-like regulatory domain-containing protein [Aquimarina algiphila]|uniref:carboxypeptidase-like regulatory domain-containing protein n=1 Tax=Aquimarina algiphila TaxID=2047982 RepID=UPI00249392B7|nr:carboxypeptidase-like regulatory domain-containing protein [Aquimarina algiphila]